MTGETDDHACWKHAEWDIKSATPGDPIQGICQVCGTEMEHYCDDHVPLDEGIELSHHKDYTDAPVYTIQYDCPACGRELEMLLKKEGTFDRNTGRQVYGP